MESSFGELTASIKESLKKRKVTPKELVNCLDGCLHDDKVLKEGDRKMFLQVKKECEKCDDFIDLWSTISEYFTFYSYKFLKAIVNSVYATKQDMINFEDYDKKFREYSKESVAKYADCDLHYLKPDGVTKVIVKIKEKFKCITDEHLDEFKKNLATAIGVSEELLHLIDLRPGCTKLTYHAPLVIEVIAFPLTARQEVKLKGLEVIWLQCGKYYFPTKVFTFNLKLEFNDFISLIEQISSNSDSGKPLQVLALTIYLEVVLCCGLSSVSRKHAMSS